MKIGMRGQLATFEDFLKEISREDLPVFYIRSFFDHLSFFHVQCFSSSSSSISNIRLKGIVSSTLLLHLISYHFIVSFSFPLSSSSFLSCSSSFPCSWIKSILIVVIINIGW